MFKLQSTPKKVVKSVLFYILLLLIGFLIILPIISVIGTAFKGKSELLTNNNIFPHQFTIENFQQVFATTPFLTYVKNSIVIAVCASLVVAVFSCLAGYAISRYSRHIRFFRYYSSLFLILQMFPGVLVLIPLVLVFTQIHLNDTAFGLTIIYISNNIPFCTWMMSGFFDGIPMEMEEAGRIDGCNVFQTFTKLVEPLSKPGIASIIIYTFIGCWNEFMTANIFLKSQEAKTIPVGLQAFIQQFTIEWGSLMAASVIALIPVLFFLIFMQKYIVAGLTSGAVKG